MTKNTDYRLDLAAATELLHSLAKGLHNVAANELAFRRRVKERQP